MSSIDQITADAKAWATMLVNTSAQWQTQYGQLRWQAGTLPTMTNDQIAAVFVGNLVPIAAAEAMHREYAQAWSDLIEALRAEILRRMNESKQ